MSAGESDARLRHALRPFLSPTGEPPARGVLLAVSGGPDSTALLHAAATGGAGVPLHVATVDHGLRAASAAEAQAVAALAAGLGLPHATLRWDARKPEAGLQEAARAARYALLAGHAARVGADRVLTAHTADDQAETVLMRLIAGSGPAGLAGMRSERPLRDGIMLGRPFLDVAKAELVAYCEARGLPFVHDPSNLSERFARGRLRKLLPLLEKEGLSAVRLLRLAARARRDDEALSRRADAVLAQARRSSEPRPAAATGHLALDGNRLLAEPEAIVLRVMERAIGLLAGEREAAPPRLERLEALVIAVLLPALREGRRLRRTLRGVLVEALPNRAVMLSEAPPRRVRQAGDGPS